LLIWKDKDVAENRRIWFSLILKESRIDENGMVVNEAELRW
jgi:hypothetical protein